MPIRPLSSLSLAAVGSLALSIAAVPAAQAQTRVGPGSIAATAGRGIIDGVVSDTGLVPLQAAFVSILGTNIRVGTGPNGRFRITQVPEGRYLVIVKRVGFRPASDVVDVVARDTARLSYVLENADVKLNPVVTNDRAPTIKMQEFDQRRRLGQGEFMTQAEIKDRNPAFSTELFRKFKSVYVAPSNSSSITQYFAFSSREGGNPQTGACTMQIVLDRVPLPQPFNLDLLPAPKDLFGIEVYSGAGTVPMEYSGVNRGCGVILVWTRDGS